jgi:hypothetical protein
MQYEGDVDSIYEDRLHMSDLDIEGFDDIGDDPDYEWVYGADDIHPTDRVQCLVCDATVTYMFSYGHGTADVYCGTCWQFVKGE